MHDILLVVAFLAIILAPSLAARSVMSDRLDPRKQISAETSHPALIEAGDLPGTLEYPGEQESIAPAGATVAERRMIATEKRLAIIERVLTSLAENQAAALEQAVMQTTGTELSGVADGPADDHFHPQVRRSQPKLLRRWSVAGRSKANSVEDPNLPEFETVVAMDGRRRRRKAQLSHQQIHEVSQTVRSASGSMATANAYSHPQYADHAGGDGQRRIVLVQVGSTLRYVEVFDIDPEPLTLITSNDLVADSEFLDDEFEPLPVQHDRGRRSS